MAHTTDTVTTRRAMGERVAVPQSDAKMRTLDMMALVFALAMLYGPMIAGAMSRH